MISLEKGKEALKVSLSKKGITTPPAAEIAFLLDVSGSFDHTHKSGVTQQLLERLVPWAMVFDPDQKLDVFTFASEPHHVGEITPATCDNYIVKSIVNRVPNYNGGTMYGFHFRSS